jgi:hypothetical protein
MARPGNRGHDDTVIGTRNARNAGDDEDLGSPEVECPPTTLAARVIARATKVAVRASPSVLNPRSQMNFDELVNEIHALHAHALGVDPKGPR